MSQKHFHSLRVEHCICNKLFPPSLPNSYFLHIFLPICPSGARAFSFAFFGAGIGPIHLDNVRCFGAEQFLINCSYTTPRFDNHFEDAGVRCAAREPRTYIHVRMYYDGDVCMYIVMVIIVMVIHCTSANVSQFVITNHYFCLLTLTHSFTHFLAYFHTHTHTFSLVRILTHKHSHTHTHTHSSC